MPDIDLLFLMGIYYGPWGVSEVQAAPLFTINQYSSTRIAVYADTGGNMYHKDFSLHYCSVFILVKPLKMTAN